MASCALQFLRRPEKIHFNDEKQRRDAREFLRVCDRCPKERGESPELQAAFAWAVASDRVRTKRRVTTDGRQSSQDPHGALPAAHGGETSHIDWRNQPSEYA